MAAANWRADAAKKAWLTIRANRAAKGLPAFKTSGAGRVRKTSGGAVRRRVKSSFKPVTYAGQSSHWATPKYKGALASIRVQRVARRFTKGVRRK